MQPDRYPRQRAMPPGEHKPPGMKDDNGAMQHHAMGNGAGTHHQMGDHAQMMLAQREKTLWMYFAIIMLGLWLLASPITFDAGNGRLAVSDAVSGALIAALGTLALRDRGDFWGRWGVCLVGIWLLFAPLVFWAPNAATYANDTLVGALVIGLSVLAPMMPGKAHHMVMMQPGPDIPPGWTYNPSTWWQRGPIIALGFASFLIARQMGAYQLGHTGYTWEPFFSPGTPAILTSEVSRAWPISDAGLGAVSYLLEVLSGFMGGVRRWRTMPWMVLMFGVLVVPLGITSIVLVIMQPLSVGTWCTPCLLTALLMLVMVPLAVDEVVAMCQFLARARREGQPLWRTFWVGGTLRQEEPDQRSPAFGTPARAAAPAMVWGVTVPWSLLASATLGLWLMAAPAILGSGGSAADSDHLVGALIVTTAVIAMGEVVRPLRFINIAFGAWLVVAPWLLDGTTTAATASDMLAGLALIALSLPRGPVRERYGGWNRWMV